MVLPNRCIVCDSSSGLCTKRVGIAKNLKPWTAFDVQWFNVRYGSHWGGSPQNGLGDERTCGMTLASAYVLCHLSATWSQLQMKERESKWE